MSAQPRFLRSAVDRLAPLLQGIDPLSQNTGSPRLFLDEHDRHCSLYHAGEHPIDPGRFLSGRITNPLAVYAAWAKGFGSLADDESISRYRAAGQDGQHLEEIPNRERWQYCRDITAWLQSGEYVPGPVRLVRIPKTGDGNKYRTIAVQNGEDRLVSGAANSILGPYTDPHFHAFSFGGRPKRGREMALATALGVAETEGRWVWAVDDVANAFDVIPKGRLLDACGKYLPSDVTGFMKVLISQCPGPKGIYQGAPISPLLCNIYFDHFLDRPWHRQEGAPPLFRYIDDLLVLARTKTEAIAARRLLRDHTTSIGMPLKKARLREVYDLRKGAVVPWLGYEIAFSDGGAVVRIPAHSWEGLADELKIAAADGYPSAAANGITIGWINAMGPTYGSYSYHQRRVAVRRVLGLCVSNGFGVVETEKSLKQRWSAAFARWTRLRKDVMSKRLSLDAGVADA